MNVLVLNCGSSTIKFQIIRTDLEAMKTNGDVCLTRGSIERLGGEAVITVDGRTTSQTMRDIRAAVEFIAGLGAVEAVGHRVVHGGERFVQSTLLDEDAIRRIEELTDLAPLHNPANVRGIRAAQTVLGKEMPQAAVFDTAFHQTLPERAYLYAIPYQYYRRYALRRYGFHGTSHRYVAYRYRQLRGIEKNQTHIITLHLGNGCSACAIRGGVSVDVSMGLTPLEGLVMGTRSGDIDPAIAHYIAEKEGMDAHHVETMLNKQSGLLGVSGLTHDMRELLAEVEDTSDRRAALAVEIFCYRARKYIGSYLAAMGGAEAIVFTGGIGENSADVRARICEGLEWMGLALDESRNEACARGVEGPIHAEGSRLAAYVIPTNEELLIARDTVRCIHGVLGK